MKPIVTIPDPRCPDMSPEAIDQRLRDLAQIYKLGMSLRGARWLGPVNPCMEEPRPQPLAHSTPDCGITDDPTHAVPAAQWPNGDTP